MLPQFNRWLIVPEKLTFMESNRGIRLLVLVLALPVCTHIQWHSARQDRQWHDLTLSICLTIFPSIRLSFCLLIHIHPSLSPVPLPLQVFCISDTHTWHTKQIAVCSAEKYVHVAANALLSATHFLSTTNWSMSRCRASRIFRDQPFRASRSLRVRTTHTEISTTSRCMSHCRASRILM